jgi:cephalosporin hydroxylase
MDGASVAAGCPRVEAELRIGHRDLNFITVAGRAQGSSIVSEIDPEFEARNSTLIDNMAADDTLRELSLEWVRRTVPYEYSYHFKWMGLPIIQLPADMIAIQEIIYRVRPQLIIETGVARGGSLVFYASLLELLANNGRVLGVEIELRPRNRRAIQAHPMARRVELIDGSSIDRPVIDRVRAEAAGCAPILVILDSNHTHAHVLKELDLYGPLVTEGSYMIVLDTVIEDLPENLYPGKAYRPGDNPKTAVREFLKRSNRFVIDEEFDRKLLMTSAHNGYLRCVG